MMTQDKETLREAVRAAYLRGFNSVPRIAMILPDGTPAAHWAGLDAAIATMFERLRDPSQGMLDAAFEKKDEHMEDIWQAMLYKCRQENTSV
jgi:hypothetical protein